MSESVLAARIEQAITEVMAAESNLVVLSTDILRGWGDVIFVRLQARLREHAGHAAVETRLRDAVAKALAPERCSVSVSWQR